MSELGTGVTMAGPARCTAVVLALLAVGCGGGEALVEHRSALAELLPPAAELDGWIVAEGPIEHTPDTVYEYLDGGADRYLTHGFRAMLHLRYQLGDDPLAGVTLDLYDMGGELGAFGIYAAARPPETAVRQWGVEGYLEDTIAAAWKGSLYVHGEADDPRPELVGMLERLVAGVCKRAAGEASWPAVLAPLPVEGRLAGSERWVPNHLLGHAFLGGGVLATYEVSGQRAELYLSDLGTETAAGEALAALRAHLARWGSVEGEVTALGDGGFRYSEPTLGAGTAVTSGSHLAGIHGAIDPEARETVLGVLLDALP